MYYLKWKLLSNDSNEALSKIYESAALTANYFDDESRKEIKLYLALINMQIQSEKIEELGSSAKLIEFYEE